MTQVSLKTLLVATKETEVQYPGKPDFLIKVAFLSRETLQKLRKKCTKTTFKNHQPVESIDDDLFLKLYVQATIKGWTGLTVNYLKDLSPINLEGIDPNAELPYSEEEALDLMKSSAEFDRFITEQVSDLGNFNKSNSTELATS